MSSRTPMFSPLARHSGSETDEPAALGRGIGIFWKNFFFGAISAGVLVGVLAILNRPIDSGAAAYQGLEENAPSDRGKALDEATAKKNKGGGGNKEQSGHWGPKCSIVGCNAPYVHLSPCQCTANCQQYGNCCSDFQRVCGAKTVTCAAVGCIDYVPGQSCQCSASCNRHGNCCHDYNEICGEGKRPEPEPAPAPVPNPPNQAPGREQWMPFPGGKRVVVDEGNGVGQVDSGGSSSKCEQQCDQQADCHSFSMCDDGMCWLKDKAVQATETSAENQYCQTHYKGTATSSPSNYHPANQALLLPSSAPLLTFYTYRAQASEDSKQYPLENVNTASLGGVIWYLHNEIIPYCDWKGHPGQRKFDKTRILRYKIQVKAPQPLFDRGMNFGVKCSVDSGACTGPAHQSDYDRFGYYMGCDYLGEYPHEEFQSGKKYPNAIWYSLPGKCPFKRYFEQTPQCERDFPGGKCPDGITTPTGTGDCVYTYEEAGDIDINEMVGISPKWNDRQDFCRKCHSEGGPNQGGGCGLHFWDDIWNERKNKERVQRAADMFKQKYPDMPGDADILTPKCDFNKNAYYRR